MSHLNTYQFLPLSSLRVILLLSPFSFVTTIFGSFISTFSSHAHTPLHRITHGYTQNTSHTHAHTLYVHKMSHIGTIISPISLTVSNILVVYLFSLSVSRKRRDVVLRLELLRI